MIDPCVEWMVDKRESATTRGIHSRRRTDYNNIGWENSRILTRMENRDELILQHPDPLHEIRTRNKVINEYYDEDPDVNTEIETGNTPRREPEQESMPYAKYGETPITSNANQWASTGSEIAKEKTRKKETTHTHRQEQINPEPQRKVKLYTLDAEIIQNVRNHPWMNWEEDKSDEPKLQSNNTINNNLANVSIQGESRHKYPPKKKPETSIGQPDTLEQLISGLKKIYMGETSISHTRLEDIKNLAFPRKFTAAISNFENMLECLTETTASALANKINKGDIKLKKSVSQSQIKKMMGTTNLKIKRQRRNSTNTYPKQELKTRNYR